MKKYVTGKNCNIGKNVSIDENVVIGHNVIIEDNVSIGANCSIDNNVIIRSNVEIGENSDIGKLYFGRKFKGGLRTIFENRKKSIDSKRLNFIYRFQYWGRVSDRASCDN